MSAFPQSGQVSAAPLACARDRSFRLPAVWNGQRSGPIRVAQVGQLGSMGQKGSTQHFFDLADNLCMDAEPPLRHHIANFAFVAGLAHAAGEAELAQRFSDSMVRAHLLSLPLVGRDALEIVFDPDRLHGASGEW